MKKISKILPFKISKLNSNEKGESYYEKEVILFYDMDQFEKASCSIPAYVSNEYIVLGSCKQQWRSDWHNEPYPLIGIMLSGKMEIEVSSGNKKIFRKGDLFIGKDVNGTGHRTGSLDQENTIAIISLHNHQHKPPTHES